LDGSLPFLKIQMTPRFRKYRALQVRKFSLDLKQYF